ncbi:MAG: biopolymer transporter ExbD [Betaproteobacteria bacterium]
MQLGELAGEGAALSDINTTPLVDVMLVLLIIFLITIPVVTTSIPVKLPSERVQVRETKPDSIIISVDREGRMYWFDAPVPNRNDLLPRLQAVARMRPQPDVQIRGDQAAQYESVGRVLLECQRAGISRVAFITEPAALGG